MGTIFLSKIFFYKIIPTYIFNSFNCCLKSVIYDVYGASTGLLVMGSLVLGFFCNLTLIHIESESLFFTLCCVFLIFLLSSNYFTDALIFFYFQFSFRHNVILVIIEEDIARLNVSANYILTKVTFCIGYIAGNIVVDSCKIW